jgi:hypothetical protein
MRRTSNNAKACGHQKNNKPTKKQKIQSDKKEKNKKPTKNGFLFFMSIHANGYTIRSCARFLFEDAEIKIEDSRHPYG